jgi:hypothetical protein
MILDVNLDPAVGSGPNKTRRFPRVKAVFGLAL